MFILRNTENFEKYLIIIKVLDLIKTYLVVYG